MWSEIGTSLNASLTIEDDEQVVVPDGITLTVGDIEYTACTLSAKNQLI